MSITQAYHKSVIMLDPAGDARQRGRTLLKGYERGETLKFAESLRDFLQENYACEIIISRSPGEEKLPLQTATFANRLSVDLVISLSFYHEAKTKPQAYIYQLAYNQLIDFAPRTYKQPVFIPLEQAHFKNIHKTKRDGERIKECLTNNHQKLLDAFGPFALPIKPLVGIISPALLIEIGIHEDNQWQSLIKPIAESIWQSHLLR